MTVEGGTDLQYARWEDHLVERWIVVSIHSRRRHLPAFLVDWQLQLHELKKQER